MSMEFPLLLFVRAFAAYLCVWTISILWHQQSNEAARAINLLCSTTTTTTKRHQTLRLSVYMKIDLSLDKINIDSYMRFVFQLFTFILHLFGLNEYILHFIFTFDLIFPSSSSSLLILFCFFFFSLLLFQLIFRQKLLQPN